MIRRIAFILLTLVVVLVGAAVVLWRLSLMTPTWYAPPDPADEQVVELAERVEYRLVEEAQKMRRSPEPWTLVVRDEQINAWLAARLPDWIAHHEEVTWPEDLGTPQVRIVPDGIELAAEWTGETKPLFVAAKVNPTIEGGQISLELGRFGVGRLGLPGPLSEAILQGVREQMPDLNLEDTAQASVAAFLEGGTTIGSEFRLADGRQVKVVRITCTQGAVHLRCVTLAER